MARVIKVVGTSPHFDVIYSVDKAVGKGCPNQRHDVLLVQFFLRVAMDDRPGVPNSGLRPPGLAPIAIDGCFGTKTLQYITFMEAEENRRHQGQLMADGRIDPAVSGTFAGSRSKLEYKIVALNTLYRSRRSREMHNNLVADPLFPTELRNILFIAL